MAVRLSVIIPALNEESTVAGLLENLLACGAEEIIVVDGGSTDHTMQIAESHASVRTLRTSASRSLQMNTGAKAAAGEALLFLHADTRIRAETLGLIGAALDDPRVIGGNLDIRFGGEDWIARVFDAINRWRRPFGIFYGDSGIFCRKAAFDSLGGYRPWPVMEDYEFARRLWKAGKLAFTKAPIEVSDRRWRRAGLWSTLWGWIVIQTLYSIGVSPLKLARMYQNVR